MPGGGARVPTAEGARERGHEDRGLLLQLLIVINPVQFMSLFGHALFNYNPPKQGRKVW